jgi:hypothetical protein
MTDATGTHPARSQASEMIENALGSLNPMIEPSSRVKDELEAEK